MSFSGRKWGFPDRSLGFDNVAVSLSPTTLTDHLLPLYDSARYDTLGVDLFEYHVNVPTMVTFEVFRAYLESKLALSGEVMYTVSSHRLGPCVGCLSLMNIRPDHGVCEVGSIWITPRAQRTEVHTNALFLLLCYVFDDLGYRRLEWKCNSLNVPSQNAARRLGFTYEGTFRQHMVSRGENRDTVWFAVTDEDWPGVRSRLEGRLAWH